MHGGAAPHSVLYISRDETGEDVGDLNADRIVRSLELQVGRLREFEVGRLQGQFHAKLRQVLCELLVVQKNVSELLLLVVEQRHAGNLLSREAIDPGVDVGERCQVRQNPEQLPGGILVGNR